MGPELRNEVRSLGTCRPVRGGEPFALAEDVLRVVGRLAREAQSIQALRAIACSELVVAPTSEAAYRDGA